MLFSKTLKLLMCFVMIFPYLLYGSTVDAASNYNHAELMDYEGYGQAMYESIVEETTFITGQYTDNKEYVNNSIDQIKDYAKFWWEENKVQGEGVAEKLKDVFVKGAAYTLTVGDWVKNLFTDYDESVNGVVDNSLTGYEYAFKYSEGAKCISALPNYYALITAPDGKTYTQLEAGCLKAEMAVSSNGKNDTGYNHKLFVAGTQRWNKTKSASTAEGYAEVEAYVAANYVRILDTTSTIRGVLKTGASIKIFYMDIEQPPRGHDFADRTINNIRNYIENDMDDKEIIIPQPKPSLTCPGGEKINLTIDGSTFLNADGSVMLVNKDGTATVNGSSCSLMWEKPQVSYMDDNVAITDPQGNWLDAITGEVLECVLEGGCVPSKPDDDKDKDKEEVEELDNSLIEYVKNAYEYATGVLKTATDGLKSLATGAKDLTALFGTFFSWLPKEMVVLMSSGLALAIGLRLFRK